LDATFGEAMSLNDALDFVAKYQATYVIFEMDSQIVVSAVKKTTKVPRDWGFVIERCVNFLRNNPNSSNNWINRKGNWVAYVLARWAEKSPNKDWPNSVPSISNLYLLS
jgi:ribonuclease HI